MHCLIKPDDKFCNKKDGKQDQMAEHTKGNVLRAGLTSLLSFWLLSHVMSELSRLSQSATA